MSSYPKRPSHFAHRFCRLLTKAAVAQEIGPEACWLLTVIAHQEDAKRYSGPVTYWNEQLMPLCGFTSPGRLIRQRTKAVDAGWLHYEPGGKGKIGMYWVQIPDTHTGLDDSPCDDSDDELISKMETEADFHSQNGKENERKTKGNRSANGNHSTLTLSLESGARSRFKKPTVEEVASYCRDRNNFVDAQRFIDHYEANGWVQGKGKPIRDWKAAVRTWESNGFDRGRNGNTDPIYEAPPPPRETRPRRATA